MSDRSTSERFRLGGLVVAPCPSWPPAPLPLAGAGSPGLRPAAFAPAFFFFGSTSRQAWPAWRPAGGFRRGGLLGGHAVPRTVVGLRLAAARSDRTAHVRAEFKASGCRVGMRRTARAARNPRVTTRRTSRCGVTDDATREGSTVRCCSPCGERWPCGDDPRSEGGRGPEVLPSRCRDRENLQLYTVRQGHAAVKSGPERAWRRCLLGRRAKLLAASCGRSSASGSIAGSSASTGPAPTRRPGLAGDALAQRRPGLRAVLGGLAVEEAEQLAVPAGQGAERARGRRRSASPTSALSSSSIQAMPVGAAGASAAGAPRRGRAPAGRRRVGAARRAAGRPRPRGPPSGGELVDRQARRATRISPSSWRFSMPSGSADQSGRPLARKRARPFGGGEVEVLRRRIGDDLARQRHRRGDRAARTPRRRARGRSCRGRARRAGTGSGSVRVSAACGRLASSARAGGAAAGGVAVEAEDDRVGEAQQLLHVLGGAGGAERRDRVAEAELGQRDDVHVALDDQGVAALAQAPCAPRTGRRARVPCRTPASRASSGTSARRGRARGRRSRSPPLHRRGSET